MSMNDNNLIPIRTRTSNERRELAQRAGKASGEARRRRRDMREAIRVLLDEPQGDGLTGTEAMAVALYSKALSGDTRSVELVLKLAGQSADNVVFTLPENMGGAQSLPKVTRAALEAVASGGMTPDAAAKLASLVAAHAKALELAELEQRIAALEATRG